MDETLAAELDARIAFNERTIETWSRGLTGDQKTEHAYSGTGQAWFDIGVCRIMLGQTPEAREAFLQAAKWAKSTLEVVRPRGSMEYGPELTVYEGALESAVLSNERSLASSWAASLWNPDPDLR